jgi:hypothetical protein
MAKVLSKPATATAIVAKVASTFKGATIANGNVALITPAQLCAWVASVGGAANVLIQPTTASYVQLGNNPPLPWGFGGKPGGVRYMQLMWALMGMAPNWQQHVTAIRNQGLTNAQATAQVIQVKHGGQLAKGVQPVRNLGAYFALGKLCTLSTQNPCVLVALLNGGVAHKFAQRSPNAGTPAVTLQVAKPVS